MKKINKSCRDCKFHESVVGHIKGDEYEHVCTNPKLQPLITTEGYGSNSWVRCNETREFNFACGVEAAWFEQRSPYVPTVQAG